MVQLANERETCTIFRIPWFRLLDDAPCIWTVPYLPSTDCSEPGFWMDYTLMVLATISKNAFRVTLQNATGFSMLKSSAVNGTTISTVDSSTILGQINASFADFSTPFITITEERMQQVNYLKALDSLYLALAYKEPPKPVAMLDVRKLWPRYITLPAATTIILFSAIRICQRVYKRLAGHESFYEQEASTMIIALAYSVILSLFSAHVTEIFNQEILSYRPFGQRGDLLLRLESMEYTAVTDSQIYIDAINPVHLKGVSERFDAYIAASKRNPPILAETREEMMKLMALGDGSNRKFVAAGGSSLHQDVRQFYCGISTAFETELFMGYDTAIYSDAVKDKIKDLTSLEARVIEVGRQKIAKKYIKSKSCNLEESEETHGQLSGWVSAYRLISLQQTSGAFITYLACVLLSGLVFFIELFGCLTLLYHRVRGRNNGKEEIVDKNESTCSPMSDEKYGGPISTPNSIAVLETEFDKGEKNDAYYTYNSQYNDDNTRPSFDPNNHSQGPAEIGSHQGPPKRKNAVLPHLTARRASLFQRGLPGQIF